MMEIRATSAMEDVMNRLLLSLSSATDLSFFNAFKRHDFKAICIEQKSGHRNLLDSCRGVENTPVLGETAQCVVWCELGVLEGFLCKRACVVPHCEHPLLNALPIVGRTSVERDKVIHSLNCL